RVDLLALDRSGALVVIELKRTEDGGHMELQAVRYAAMISTMGFQQTVAAHAKFLRGEMASAEAAILDFLGSPRFFSRTHDCRSLAEYQRTRYPMCPRAAVPTRRAHYRGG